MFESDTLKVQTRVVTFVNVHFDNQNETGLNTEQQTVLIFHLNF